MLEKLLQIYYVQFCSEKSGEIERIKTRLILYIVVIIYKLVILLKKKNFIF